MVCVRRHSEALLSRFLGARVQCLVIAWGKSARLPICTGARIKTEKGGEEKCAGLHEWIIGSYASPDA